MMGASDQRAIRALLCGETIRNKRGRILRQDYPEPGSAEERGARRALAKLLRTSTPDPGVLFIVADFIDPDCATDREIRFARRKRNKGRSGRPPLPARSEKEIAEFIWAQLKNGAKMKAAVSCAVEHFGYSEKSKRHVKDIWRCWEPILKRLHRSRPLSAEDWPDSERARLGLIPKRRSP